MKDSFNREVDYLRISVTDRCNLRCSYCMPDGMTERKSHEEILRDEEIIEIVKEATKIGIKKVRITGGEPLVRKGIYSLIKKINDVEGIDEVSITTNATLLLGNVKKLKDSGVNRINFSMDTLDKKKYNLITKSNIGLDYISLIQELKANNIEPIKINAVLLRDFNVAEIPGFIALADEFDLLIRFIELMPVGHLEFDYDKHYISKKEVLEMFPELQAFRQDIITDYYSVKNKKGLIGFINPISDKFCNDCNRIRLTADGNLKPCLHTDEEIYVKTKENDELLNLIKTAINNKPKSHKVDESKANQIKRPMNKIGG